MADEQLQPETDGHSNGHTYGSGPEWAQPLDLDPDDGSISQDSPVGDSYPPESNNRADQGYRLDTLDPATVQSLGREVLGVLDGESHSKKEARNRLLLDHLNRQVDILLRLSNEKREILKPRDLKYLKYFLNEIITERNMRAEEIEKPQIKQAAEIIAEMFGMPIFGKLCIDGRVSLTMAFGFPGGTNHQINVSPQHTRAGDPKDFELDEEDGHLILIPNSPTAKKIDRALANSESLIEIYDSHTNCLARDEMALQQVGPTADKGLYMDVKAKAAIARAIGNYVSQRHAGKKLINLQFSSDPHHGYCFEGLETEYALTAAQDKQYAQSADQEKAGGFTAPVLKKLVEEGKIISTREFAEKDFAELFQQTFSQFSENHNWVDNYASTALQFWQSIQKMKDQGVLDQIKAKISKPGAPYEHVTDQKDLEIRSLLLLASAFNGFCNNRTGHYPDHGHHNEEAVSISNGRDNPPHKTMLFRVSSRNLKLAEDAKKSGQLVRGARAEGRVNDTGNFYGGSGDIDKDKDAFVAAPIAYPVKEVYEAGNFTEDEWDEITNIDWSFLNQMTSRDGTPLSWDEADVSKIMVELSKKTKLSFESGAILVIGIRKLLQTVRILYKDQDIRELISKGKIVLVPVLCDRNGVYRSIIPLGKKNAKHSEEHKGAHKGGKILN